MIDPNGERELSTVMASLKRQSPDYFRIFVAALQACCDPEFKAFVAAPVDKLANQQGRVQFSIELMEVVVKCEQYEQQRLRAAQPPQPAQANGGWAHG